MKKYLKQSMTLFLRSTLALALLCTTLLSGEVSKVIAEENSKINTIANSSFTNENIAKGVDVDEPESGDTASTLDETQNDPEKEIDLSIASEENQDEQSNNNEVQNEPKLNSLRSPRALVANGVSGTVTWTLDDTGVLTFSGGTFADLWQQFTWTTYKNDITKIVFTVPVVAGDTINTMFADMPNLMEIENLSFLDTTNTSEMIAVFARSSNLTAVDVSNFKTSNVTTMAQMFSGLNKVTFLDVGDWDTSKVTSMWDMFYCFGGTTLDVSNWNVSKVTDFRTFIAGSLITDLDVSKWDTASAEDMWCMFQGANLNAIDVSNFKMSKVTRINHMFARNVNLTTIDVSKWDTSSLRQMSSVFYNLPKITTLDVSNWKTDKVTHMEYAFSGCTKLSDIDVSNWDTTALMDLGVQGVFQRCESLITLNISSWSLTQRDIYNRPILQDFLFEGANIRELIVGENFKLDREAKLNTPSSVNKYNGNWEYVPTGETVTPSNLLNYDGSKPGKYVWQEAVYELWFETDNTYANFRALQQNLKFQEHATRPADPVAPGFTFVKWVKTSGGDDEWVFDVDTMPSKTTYIYAKWQANPYVNYSIEHYVELVDGTYTLADTDARTAPIGATAQVEMWEYKSYYGFTSDMQNPNKVTSGEVTADGSLTLKLYYTRDQYTVIFKDYDGSVISNTRLKQGATVTIPANPTRAGYTFAGWTPTVMTIMPAGNITYTATYTSDANKVAYKVEHYQEQLDGSYTVFETEDLQGTKDTTVNATAKTYTGYTHVAANTSNVLSGTVAADGSLILKVYYDLNTYTATFNDHDGTKITSVNLKFGAAINAPADPFRLEYTFLGWTPTVDATMPANDVTYTATYKAHTYTPFITEYYQEQLDGSYVLKEVQNNMGVTDQRVMAEVPNYAGYTWNSSHPNQVSSGIITADGKLVLKMYYDINNYKVTFKDFDGTEITSANVKVGDAITAPANPRRDGFIFVGWTPTVAATMPANDVTYTATYSQIGDTMYKISYYIEQLDGSYILLETRAYQGLVGDTVPAIIIPVEGYTHDPANTNNVLEGVITADGNLMLKVYYTRNEYSVTFKDHDGTVLATFTGKHGTPFTAPANPTRLLYIFTHWSEVLRVGLPRAIYVSIPTRNVVYIANYQTTTVPPTPEVVVKPIQTPAPAIGRTCQDDGYASGYYWNGTACVVPAAYTVPNTGVK